MAWEYLPLLNESIKILLTIILGVILGHFGVFDAAHFVPAAIKFVFHVGLPMLVLRALGIGIDFYSDKYLWNYIGAFLILRAIALITVFLWVLFMGRKGHYGIGQVAVLWLSLTWISTVILGVPIAHAVFGNENLGRRYGVLAAISSFIFQLPVQLLFLECHVLEQEYLESRKAESYSQDSTKDEEAPEPNALDSPIDEEMPSTNDNVEIPEDQGDWTGAKVAPCTDDGTPAVEKGVDSVPLSSEEIVPRSTVQDPEFDDTKSPLVLWVHFARRRDVWQRVAFRIAMNPVIWGIVGGFILTLSTIGPRWLLPSSPDFVEGLGWVWALAEWIGNCVSPLSLFAMGVWMHSQGRKLFLVPWHVAAFFMICKLILVPLLMVGLAKAVNLNDEAGRAAVLIASLPISMVSFSLGGKYKIGEALLSENVTLGTILLLPTVLIWNVVMDAINLFPIAK